MTKILLLLLCVLLNFPVAAANLLPGQEVTGKMGTLTVKRWITPQGMPVLFAPSNELPMVDIRLVFDAGAARDQYRYAGVAKLTNTLMFEGSKHLSADDLAITFENLGSQYGNGSYRDMAVLDFRTLSDAKVLNKTIETINYLLKEPLFDQKVLDREINKLKVAIELGKQNPSTVAGKSFFKALYDYSEKMDENKHPYANQPEGTMDSLDLIKRKHLLDFYQQYYVAQNAILAIVGDMTIEQAKDVANQFASQLPQGKHAPQLPVVRKNMFAQSIKLEHNSTQSTIIVGQAAIKRGAPDYYALYVGNHILGGSGFSSRLVKDIRVKHGLTYSVHSNFAQMREKGPFKIALTTKNKSAQNAVKLVRENLINFMEQGPTEEELKEAKLNISGSFPLRTASNQDINEHLAVIGFYDLPLDYLQKFKRGIEYVNIEDIQYAFKRNIDVDKLITVVVGKNTAE
ncbi:MAG: insulinase family protein [Gammaproteobacteria bacterium]|nr:insulinase family protein [Gammaproteobacteria bacterium]